MALRPLEPTNLTFAEVDTPQIQIESWSNAARVIQLRGFTKDQLISKDHTTNADRSRASETIDISDFPISLQVSPAVAPVRRGECYVRITLLLGGFPVGRLMAAYLTDGRTLTWPEGIHEGFTEGAGLVRSLTGTNPAAGSGVDEDVPTNARWKFLGVKVQLVADATVIERANKIQFNDGSAVIFEVEGGGITASQTKNLYFAPGYSDDTAGSNYHLNTPEILLFQGWGFTIAAGSLQAGDDYGAPTIVVEEWIEE